MAEKTNSNRRGRPAGSTNVSTIVNVPASRCPTCQSTRRSGYLDRSDQEFAGIDADGKPFNRIVRRRTRCLDCGQLRIDRSLEYKPA